MDMAQVSREARARLAQAGTPDAPREVAPSPYVDVTDPQPIPGTRKVALIVRDERSSALYACSRNESGNGRAARLHVDALATLGFVHVSDTETLKECGFVPAPAPESKPKSTPAKKASDSK